MRPVRTDYSNLIYTGPTPEIIDLHCQRIREGVITSIWWLTPAERLAIANGGNVRLTMYQEPIPPIAMNISDEQGIGEDSPDLLNRLEIVRG